VLTHGRVGETYNIGARCERTNLQLAERICDIIDELAPAPGGTSRPLISHVADRPGHDRRYAIDPSKIERELGWKAAFAFDAALRQTVHWFLAQPPKEG
jgi:dTDP-glucose 4,6-dehydratase